MRKTFVALLVLPLIGIATYAAAEETMGSGMSASEAEAVDIAEAMVAKRVESACATKAKGGVAEGIAPTKCKVDKLSTGKWSAVCTVKFACKNS